ncbi:hypothetical protein GNX71_18415 [Variovorax sp. RKNM96]|uniref:hypothetical protein n=1 Tax=Variovorax sp. RKNM96 TaxID=2681552 RepID=UPI00197EEE99|nr:hypothetical protein [Variovorax sp. RKNM96]QSI31444.1 hypothetical protein GNX71_18415 [Variovorax sp. RKNM96]
MPLPDASQLAAEAAFMAMQADQTEHQLSIEALQADLSTLVNLTSQVKTDFAPFFPLYIGFPAIQTFIDTYVANGGAVVPPPFGEGGNDGGGGGPGDTGDGSGDGGDGGSGE